MNFYHKVLLEIPPLNECDFSWITEINELIEVILEKSHKFTVGFPFNTRVKTLNHWVWFQCDSVWFRVISVWFSLIQVDFSLIQADSGWFRLISRLECDFIEGKTGITLQCDFTEGKTGITLTTVWFHRRQIWNHTESTEINWNQLKSPEIKLKLSEITLKSSEITLIQPKLTCDDSGLTIVLWWEWWSPARTLTCTEHYSKCEHWESYLQRLSDN